MSELNKNESATANLQDDIAALKRDVAGLMEHLKLGATAGVQSASDQIDDSAHRVCRSVSAEGERAAKAISRQVEAQPLVALLVALGVGYVGGRMLSR
jgi:ElaB/YqjD/DUF883 family membrane-anchored ribosome-binding protein